jgi:hypothetical protein
MMAFSLGLQARNEQESCRQKAEHEPTEKLGF